MRVYLTHLGCRLNESEIEQLAWRFVSRDHEIVANPDAADLCVVNSCTVTGEAGRKTRRLIRRLGRLNPDARIAVTGCHATISPEELVRLPNVDWVVHNDRKDALVEIVAGPAAGEQVCQPYPVAPGVLGRTRAFVKAQDGCDNNCSFCVTTVARGRGRSYPVSQIIAQVQRLVDVGFREVVLTGVHLGSYGRDFGAKQDLPGLVQGILAETDVERLRLSSLEPWDIDPGFFDLWTNDRLCRQLHLPLQSGSDRILRLMRRRTRTDEFVRLVASARERIPDVALTTDVIVGFPGEGDDDFAQTYHLVETLRFARVHVFPYSLRPDTPAARMRSQVPKDVKTARSRSMRRLGERLAREYHSAFVGRTLPVLWELGSDGDLWTGLTDNYLTVKTVTSAQLGNRVTPAKLVKLKGRELQGLVASTDWG
jgi:threonylcarbamoyladenosine tRNA methylthiotransferase MtaB